MTTAQVLQFAFPPKFSPLPSTWNRLSYSGFLDGYRNNNFS